MAFFWMNFTSLICWKTRGLVMEGIFYQWVVGNKKTVLQIVMNPQCLEKQNPGLVKKYPINIGFNLRYLSMHSLLKLSRLSQGFKKHLQHTTLQPFRHFLLHFGYNWSFLDSAPCGRSWPLIFETWPEKARECLFICPFGRNKTQRDYWWC